jgi:hypothetical protein
VVGQALDKSSDTRVEVSMAVVGDVGFNSFEQVNANVWPLGNCGKYVTPGSKGQLRVSPQEWVQLAVGDMRPAAHRFNEDNQGLTRIWRRAVGFADFRHQEASWDAFRPLIGGVFGVGMARS